MSNKKIAFFITSTGWGGLEMNVLKLAGLLTKKGFSITLITQSASTINTKSTAIFDNTVLIKQPKKYFDFSKAKQIASCLRTNNISSILVFDNKDLDVIAWCKKLFFRKLKVIYQQHMQIGINKKSWLHTFRYSSINKWISPLPYLKKEVGKRTKFDTSKVEIIPIGLDINKFVTKTYTKQQALQKLNIQPKHTLVGIVGRISEKKGQLFLAKAIHKLQQKAINVELLIFGSATVNDADCVEYEKQLHKFVKTNNLNNTIHFIPYTHDIAQFYNAIDIFALASHSETYGMVTIEAMLSGLPIIATNSGGTSQILEDGNLGALYDYNNTDDFCNSLKNILKDDVNAQQKALKAKQIAISKYNQEHEATEIAKIIENI